MTTVYQAISAVMGDVREVRKGERNQVQGFSFRGIDAVMNAVGPVLRKHGVFVVPNVESCEYTTVVVGAKRTEMGHAQLIVAFTWYGPEGDSIVSRVAAEAMDSGDKAISKAHSVAMRTAMIQTLALPTDEQDPDADSPRRSDRSKPPAQEPAAPPRVAQTMPEPVAARAAAPAAPQTGERLMTDAQLRNVQRLFTKHRFRTSQERHDYVLKTIGVEVENSRQLTVAQAARLIDALEALPTPPPLGGDDPWTEVPQ